MHRIEYGDENKKNSKLKKLDSVDLLTYRHIADEREKEVRVTLMRFMLMKKAKINISIRDAVKTKHSKIIMFERRKKHGTSESDRKLCLDYDNMAVFVPVTHSSTKDD